MERVTPAMPYRQAAIIATLIIATLLAAVFSLPLPARAQAGFDDERVMLQGFYWESHRHGHPGRFPRLGDKVWYDIVRENAGRIRSARFDLVWLPPPWYAGENSAGYNPRQYFRFSNYYGDNRQHRALLEALLRGGVEPVADIVVNHRESTQGWTDFRNPSWGLWAVCRDDEAFTNPNSPVRGTPEDRRGRPEERPVPYGSGYGPEGRNTDWGDFRDLDHTNAQVRRDILRSLLGLRSLGYRGWRYDVVHGYHARWVALYNRRTRPTFSVGEYDWGRHSEQRGWVWHSAATPGDLKTSSAVFDFTTFFALKNNKGNHRAWYGVGMIGDRTDGIAWKQRSVTFVENHDTGFRTEEDGRPQAGHERDSFANGREVEQAYAYVLTHPGVPCVYWKHYFDWGQDLRNKIRALVNARKVAGVHAGSALRPQDNAPARGVYAAMVEGKKGQLYVRIGGSDADWQPSASGYRGYREYARGADWKAWVKLPGNPPVRQAPLKAAFPIPQFKPIEQIQVPDAWLN